MPDGSETNSEFEVYGCDSKQYKRAHSETLRKAAEQKANGDDVCVEDVNAAVYGACIASWTNVEWNGETLECTPDNIEFFMDNAPWCHSQIADEVENRANFTKRRGSN